PLWVRTGHQAVAWAMSALPPKADIRWQASACPLCAISGLMQCSKTNLFDHLVGAGEQLRRHREAERAGGRQGDDELEFGRLHHRQVGRLAPLENATHIDADLTIRIPTVGSIAHQPASFGILTHVIDCWKGMSCRQYSKLDAAADKERIRSDQQR